MRRPLSLLAILLCLLPVAACGGDGGDASEDELTVYSGRNEKLLGELIESFRRQSGLEVKVRYGDSAELAATIAEEGARSPADVFFSQDAGALGAVEEQLGPLPPAVAKGVPERFRDPRGRWSGTSARARVAAYSTERVRAGELPDSVFDFTDAKWKGKLGFAPPNASFQAFVSAMRLDVGDKRTREWLVAIKRNKPKLYDNNIQAVEAIARGEVDVGFVNHYYLYELRAERPDLPVRNHTLRPGDPGSLVNTAGAGILASADHRPQAERFVRYLQGREAQTYFARKTFEYPLAAGVQPIRGLPPLSRVTGPGFALGRLGGQLRGTLRMLEEAGFST
ncbi:MAG: iron ABC transporter substrate-binding protein [Actinomycetota bacterium]|nr:iron ABC transporter substrate-binding protein [Actinomycetota bacterium]